MNFRYTEIDHDLGSDANFDVGKSWIKQCRDDHDPMKCPPLVDVELPKRLVDVTVDIKNPHPRLMECTGQIGQYLALSHCWGASVRGERLTTTQATLKARMKSIPLDTMPANFRDAVLITRKLGYRYVWVDSLCIVQDSAKDWEIESSRMGDIYMRAALTIAAAGAIDSDGGMLVNGYGEHTMAKFAPSQWFLTDRQTSNRYAHSNTTKPRTHKPRQALLRIHSSPESPQVNLTPWLSYSDLEENWYRCVVVGPLAHRAWTLQERILSHRTLYYGQRQIYWQCASSRKAADGENVPTSASTSAWSQSSDHSEWPDLLGYKTKDCKNDSIAAHSFRMTWLNILQIYVSRILTYKADKLPALAGIAAVCQNFTGYQYVAGLWREDLVVGLVWTPIPIWAKGSTMLDYTIPAPMWESHNPAYEGPSWSWASTEIRGLLEFWGKSRENRMWKQFDAQVIDIQLTLKGNNPFGTVAKGKLVLRGLVHTRWDGRVKGWNPIEHGFYGAWDWISDYTCWHSKRYMTDRVELWDYPPRHGVSILPKLFQLICQVIFSILTVITWQGIAVGPRLESIHDKYCPYCVRCVSLHMLSVAGAEEHRIQGSNEKFAEVRLWSLILEPVNGQDNVYRRIGVARKDVVITRADYLAFREGDDVKNEPPVPKYFSEWKYETIEII